MRNQHTRVAFVVLTILLVVVGCKKDDPVLITCYPVTLTDVIAGITQVTTINYNDDNTVSSFTGTIGGFPYSIAFGYDANKKVESAVYTGGISTQQFTYDGSGRLIESVVYGTAGFTYNTVGQLATMTLTQTDYLQVYTYQYPNLITRNYSQASIVTTFDSYPPVSNTIDVEYDDKRYLNNTYPGTYRTSNNITKISEGGAILISFSYLYNDQGYPTSVITTTGGTSSTQTIAYNCK